MVTGTSEQSTLDDAFVLAECQIRQIDANSFLVSSDPDLDDELGIEEDTSDSDWN